MNFLPTKEALCDEISAILEVELSSLERMTNEDLEKLLVALKEPSKLIQTGIKQLRTKARSELLERPLKEFLDKPIFNLKSDRNGPLGFGILPKLFGKKAEE